MKKSESVIANIQCSVCSLAKRVLLLFTFHSLIFTLSAQSVSASLDRDKILLGEQVTMQLTVTNVNEGLTFLSSWPQINDTINHTEILMRTPIDTISVNGTFTYRQNFTLTSFDSGKWQLGPFVFVVQDKASGKQIKLTTSPLYVTVLAVDVSALKDYHPIKDIIDVQTSFDWTTVIIGVAILVLAIIIFIIIKKRKKKIAVEPKIILKGTPLERAIDKLQALQTEQLQSTDDIKKFHTQTDIITRQYFEEMMQVKALQLTTTELFIRMHVYMQDATLRRRFQLVFETNASVKFAKYFPEANESKSMLKETISSLQQIDDLVNAAKNNANRLVQKY